jgi:hypothetical protein
MPGYTLGSMFRDMRDYPREMTALILAMQEWNVMESNEGKMATGEARLIDNMDDKEKLKKASLSRSRKSKRKLAQTKAAFPEAFSGKLTR